jgi:uncharacterized protein YgbK (DUF1537 family)
VFLGCIADDVTGASDLALMLSEAGFRTVQVLGVPEPGRRFPDADAVVVALKSRTLPPRRAVRQSLAALRALREAGARRCYFKYCSTFDSTDRGNIGPVAEALARALGQRQTVFCPAVPDLGRTVCHGHLFVHGRPLHETGMRDHPLTPMRDSDLTRLLARQSRGAVGLLTLPVLGRGPADVRRALAALPPLVVADAMDRTDLDRLGAALKDVTFTTGASGLATAWARACRRGVRAPSRESWALGTGPAALLAGSCSPATRRQVARFRRRHPALRLDVRGALRGEDAAGRALRWAAPRLDRGPVLIYSSAGPGSRPSDPRSGGMVERTFGELARRLVELGVTRLVVAGGETSGAVLDALGVRTLRIGPAIEPGVPWTRCADGPRLSLALKSGNFGSEDFFERALEARP